MINAENERKLSGWKLIGEYLPLDHMSVYVPYVMSIDGGYKLYDKIEMTVNDTSFTFIIKGFIDDAFFSSLDTGILGVYMAGETLEYVDGRLDDIYNTDLIFSNRKENNKDIETGIRNIIRDDPALASVDVSHAFFSLDLALVSLSRVMMASIIAVMMVAFAAIITAVCLIVVKFRIGNSIEEDMAKIGSLKSIGYTSGQIILSIVMQFCMIALAGSVVGIALSYTTIPALSNVFAHQTGLMWTQGFDSLISGIALCSVLLVVIIVSYLSARRIRRLNPIAALRGGINTHSFRRNYMPLDKSKGVLPMVLAFKSMFQNMKQSLMIGLIFIVVSFSSAFSVVMYYNTMIDTKAFAETPGIELSNAVAILNADADNAGVVEDIENMEQVERVQFLDDTRVLIDGNDMLTFVMEDYSSRKTVTVYYGRYPVHDNEIALSGHLSKLLDKHIGDSVTAKSGEKQAEFIVTGLTQGSSMGGYNASLTLGGIKKINPDFRQQALQIYLNEGVKSASFIEEIEALYGEFFVRTVDMDKELIQGMSIYTSIVSKVGVAMLAITIFVAILVLYFVINSSVVRRKRDIGIQKAVGFTTFQLMNQISLGFLPPIILGVISGCVIGVTQTNPIMSLCQSSMGIVKANFIITPFPIALFGVLLVIVSYITSLIITFRIRKISPYSLICE